MCIDQQFYIGVKTGGECRQQETVQSWAWVQPNIQQMNVWKKKKKEQYILVVGEDLNKLCDHTCVNITQCVGWVQQI